MSHYHAEIVIPPTPMSNIKACISQVMDHFKDVDEDGEKTGRDQWWDWWVIGGRFSGSKLEAKLDKARLEAFHQKLIELKVTVSALSAGKQSLSPPSQIPMVDAWWREWFPGMGDKCQLFSHSWNQYENDAINPVDVFKISELATILTCDRLIIAAPHWDNEKAQAGMISPAAMQVGDFWNGVSWQDTKFDGLVLPFLAKTLDDAKAGEGSGLLKTMTADWLVVTVDYHN